MIMFFVHNNDFNEAYNHLVLYVSKRRITVETYHTVSLCRQLILANVVGMKSSDIDMTIQRQRSRVINALTE